MIANDTYDANTHRSFFKTVEKNENGGLSSRVGTPPVNVLEQLRLKEHQHTQKMPTFDQRSELSIPPPAGRLEPLTPIPKSK